MNVLTVCSGIGAPEVAWRGLGWNYIAGSDIEAFPNAVRAHHFPSVPNWGDMTKFAEWPDANVDLLVGGTPCQSFSVAGLRKGLADPRGNLALTFLAIAARYAPRWILWENVPGVLSSGQGRDFGAFLGGLGQCGYGWAYRVLDAQYFGVPQRRRRVFVVGCAGDWRRAAAVLFERHSLSGHPAPRREKGQGTSGFTPSSFGGYREGAGTLRAEGGDFGGGSEQLVASNWPAEVAPTLNAHFGDKMGLEDQHALNGAGCFVPVCFSAKDHGADASDISPTLRAGGHSKSHANAGVMPAVAFPIDTMNHIGRSDSHSLGDFQAEAPSYTITKGHSHGAARGSAVRRLTPRECERLQGFPDDYTLVPYRNKPAADGPRYKALGNSMAVPVMSWIGERIQMVEALDLAEAA